LSSGFKCFHRNILNVLLYGLLINFVYTVCRIYISYIRFVVYNRNRLNVLLYGLLINCVYTVCRIYISNIRFVVYNRNRLNVLLYGLLINCVYTVCRIYISFCLGDLLGGSPAGMLGVLESLPALCCLNGMESREFFEANRRSDLTWNFRILNQPGNPRRESGIHGSLGSQGINPRLGSQPEKNPRRESGLGWMG